MSSYKTPGVYVEEIVKFPPSVAQVETAIPSFVGYTEIATNRVKGDLEGKPTRITSMLEYETFFGFAQLEKSISVTVEESENSRGDKIRKVSVAEPKDRSPYLMYYSLQMYFANGGGPCYVTSVGGYKNNVISMSELKQGLDAVRKIDEVTLLVFPDATSIGDLNEFYALYNDALTQCNELQDRFTIMDTYSSENEGTGQGSDVYNLRDKINLEKDYLKYGAAYYPFIETILDYRFLESDVKVLIKKDVVDVSKELEDYANNFDVTELKKLIDYATLKTKLADLNDDASKKQLIEVRVEEIKNELKKFEVKFGEIIEISREDSDLDSETNRLDSWLTDRLENAQLDLNKFLDGLNNLTGTRIESTLSSNASNSLGRITNNLPKIISDVVVGNGQLKKLVDKAKAKANSGSYDTSASKELTLDLLRNGEGVTATGKDNQLYNQIMAEIRNLPITLPPSSAMAGVYARVDTDRGVWKAPANVGLNYVIKPKVQISHEEQRDLNIDVVSGKSINAIRTFVGKGTLVWGARTLAGNDNEWRYVSVRRFFNMAEESIKKATEQLVFEPNDKNTWVRVKAMIDNFLTLQWRAGALAGPTPEKAFFVSVGLGETMTAQDVAEGTMIVEIGMAAVRPAEFIVLKFSHKMQEA